MTKIRLAEMTQSEFARRTREPVVILIPLGSQEVQGPHCPMGDHILAERLSELAASRADALVAPGLAFGYADFFRPFAGGMQLRPETFKAVLRDMLESLLQHGLHHLLIVNGHGGNAPLISQLARELRREYGVMIPSIDLWTAVPDRLLRELFGCASVRGHGGEPISSVAMHLFPTLCRPDLRVAKAPRGQVMGLPVRGVSGASFGDLRVNLPLDADEIDPNGLLGGTAELASARAGERLSGEIVETLARLIEHLQRTDPRASVDMEKP